MQEQFAQVAERPDQLSAFADTNTGHPLAGVAYLQVADGKFEAANYKDAATYYTKAAGSLKNQALLGRAKLGAAISQMNGGDNTTGEAALKTLSADQTLPKAVQAEATYHLASLAYEAGKSDEVKKLVEEITKIDLSGPWSQRATMLLDHSQADHKSANSTADITFKPEVK